MSVPAGPTPDRLPEIGSELTFFGCWFCPYVQRVWCALNAKKMKFNWVEIDPMVKPGWFTEAVPANKVPVIAFKDENKMVQLSESMVLLEFLEDYDSSTPMIPRDAVGRANTRLFFQRFDSKFIPAWYGIIRSATFDDAHKHAKALEAEMKYIDGQLEPLGALADGKLSAVDCAMLPWFVRAQVLKTWRGYDMVSKMPERLQSWYGQIMDHPNVTETFVAPEGEEYFEAMDEHYIMCGSVATNFFETHKKSKKASTGGGDISHF